MDSDLEPVFAYRSDPQVARYQGWDIPYPREKLVHWANAPDISVPTEPGSRLRTALECKSTGEIMGDVGFFLTKDDVRQADIWYTLARATGIKGMRPKPFRDYWPSFSMT